MNIYGGSDGKESACNARDLCSIPRLGRSPGKGNGYPLLYSCLENLHGQRSLVGHSPWDHKELDTTEQLTLSLFHWWMHSIWDLVPAHMCVRVCVCVCVCVYFSTFWPPFLNSLHSRQVGLLIVTYIILCFHCFIHLFVHLVFLYSISCGVSKIIIFSKCWKKIASENSLKIKLIT